MTNLLGLYGGCDSDELRRIRKLPSRWVALCTTFPSIVLYEGGAYLLHSDKEDQPLTHKPSKLVASIAHSTGKKRPRTGGGGGGNEDEEGDDGEDDAGY